MRLVVCEMRHNAEWKWITQWQQDNKAYISISIRSNTNTINTRVISIISMKSHNHHVAPLSWMGRGWSNSHSFVFFTPLVVRTGIDGVECLLFVFLPSLSLWCTLTVLFHPSFIVELTSDSSSVKSIIWWSLQALDASTAQLVGTTWWLWLFMLMVEITRAYTVCIAANR